jgi:hypothetical protein
MLTGFPDIPVTRARARIRSNQKGCQHVAAIDTPVGAPRTGRSQAETETHDSAASHSFSETQRARASLIEAETHVERANKGDTQSALPQAAGL